jgi:propionyl-CoA carboxylase alpha chain
VHVEPVEFQRTAIAAALWLQGRNRMSAASFATLPSGWRNARLPAQRVVLKQGELRVEIEYERRRDGSFLCGNGMVARILGWSERGIDVVMDDRRISPRITAVGEHVYVQTSRGTLGFDVLPRFPEPAIDTPIGALTAPMPGTAREVRVSRGQPVASGDVLIVLEAMKMEHHIRAAEPGVVAAVNVTAGATVETGTVLLIVDPLEPGMPG